jgi:two-component system, OmpR family, sensor kinase
VSDDVDVNTAVDLRAVTVEAAGQAALVGVAWAGVEVLHAAGVPARVPAGLVTVGVAVAAVVLVVASWLGDDRRARRIAAAVGVYTVVALLLRIIGDGPGPQVMAASVAVLGMVGLLALSVAGLTDPRRDRVIALGVLGAVAAGLLAAGIVVPGQVVAGADLVAWSGAGAAGLVLVLAGTVLRRALLRRAGIAFVTLAAANAVRIASAEPARPVLAVALEGGAVAMLLAAAVPFLRTTVRAMARQRDASRARLAQAEAVMAGIAERDHELRNLVAGLSGAARVLTDDTVASLDGRRLLEAAGSELDRLHRMLNGDVEVGPGETGVGRVLRDLALVHRAGGLDVWVEVDGDPQVAVQPAVLAQVLTNLLVNCARHAPGARVWLRARTRGDQVRIEVVDDGPGLPSGAAADVLRRGVREPGSTGAGLGLAISAELVERHDGTFLMLSGSGGCTAVLDLPRAARDVAAVGA